MKHKLSKSVIIMLTTCVACVLAFGATLAQAGVDSGLGGINELVVKVADPGSYIKDADAPQISVYRIATGSKDTQYDTYNYTFDLPAFAALDKGYDLKAMNADSWKRMAEEAQKIVNEGGVSPDFSPISPVNNEHLTTGVSISGLTEGIYLVMLSDTSSPTHTFTFSPALVAVPGKVDAGKPVYNTANGVWTNSTDPITPVEVSIKWGMAPRYGSLQINKIVEDFSGEPASFVFHVYDTATQGTKYNEYATVQYTAEGAEGAVLSHIPVGLNLTVHEEYQGGRYSLVSDNDIPVTIAADETTTVSFTNKSNDFPVGGHGIENHFKFHYDEEKSDWEIEVNAIIRSEVELNDQSKRLEGDAA